MTDGRSAGPVAGLQRWDEGNAYDRFMGRWSELVAERFLEGLDAPSGWDWLDVGCGTGVLLEAIRRALSPRRLAGVDPSAGFLAVAAERLSTRVELRVADGEHLPFADHEFDAIVSGLALNFMPDRLAAVNSMRRVTRPGGLVAAYVWDYADGMEFLRRFWDATTELDPQALELDEGRRFPDCRPEQLRQLFEAAALSKIRVSAIEVPTTFSDFDDYWQPFLAGQGPAAGYVAALPSRQRRRLQDRLQRRLATEPDGSIRLHARAWAVTGQTALP